MAIEFPTTATLTIEVGSNGDDEGEMLLAFLTLLRKIKDANVAVGMAFANVTAVVPDPDTFLEGD